MPLAPVISISHGGGPLPLLNDPGHTDLVRSMRTKVPSILHLADAARRPRAIVVVTAHWEEDIPTISGAAKHPLYYDYYGFPPETYQIRYDAPGSPEVAGLVRDALTEQGIESRIDTERGWDHGVFIPLLLINPAADIPVIQLSILSSQSARSHFAYGAALSSLRAHNIAIVCSGFATYHNMRLGFQDKPSSFTDLNARWSAELAAAVEVEDPQRRGQALEKWRTFAGSAQMHPVDGAEHFMPLIVAGGAGGPGKAKSWTDDVWGMKYWSFWWD